MSDTAKIFWSGRSQAVRLPKEFRMNGDAVRIRRQGSAVILEPLVSDWEWLDESPAGSRATSSPRDAISPNSPSSRNSRVLSSDALSA